MTLEPAFIACACARASSVFFLASLLETKNDTSLRVWGLDLGVLKVLL